MLMKGGYKVLECRPFDMFPFCDHVETVVLLSKLDVDKHIDVEIDSLSDEELFKPHMRKWADDATKTAVWEVYKFIYVNTVAPFKIFRNKIRKWKKIVL